ncbi:MAG: phenylpyruvate tautomerase MIF-related protein [Clostridia bacterium]|nr:phenylpyruvate tautomerase MIF-related protein [Clostridia bacterium]
MPNITTKTNASISKEKEIQIKSKLGKAISLLAGKSEAWLMCSFEDNCRLWFQGSDEPAAFVEVQVFGKINPAQAEDLTAEICNILSGELAISQDRIYVKYEEVSIWGWNGGNF